MMLKIINMMLKIGNKDKEKNSTSDMLSLTLIQKIKIIPKEMITNHFQNNVTRFQMKKHGKTGYPYTKE